MVLLAVAATVPGRHAVGLTEPSEHALPGGQSKQSSCEAWPVRFPKEPAAHSVGVDAPVRQKPPSVHGTHAVCALLLIDDWLRLTRVSLHIRHCIPSSLAVPGRQGWQKLRSPLGSRPAGQSTQVL